MSCSVPLEGLTNVPETNAEYDEVTELLFEQAEYWQSRSRGDLSRIALERILLSQSNNERALFEMGKSYCIEGEIKDANINLKRLQAINPTGQYTEQLKSEIKVHSYDRSRLELARQLARENKVEKSIQVYDEVFATRPLEGNIALEYYQLLAAKEGEYTRSVVGLRQLLRKEPNNIDKTFALAKVLSYREENRRESLLLFQSLVDKKDRLKSDFYFEVLDAYATALLWLHASHEDEELFNQYLMVDPDNVPVQERLNRLTLKVEPDTYIGKIQAAYRALKIDNFVKAEELLDSAIAINPNGGDAWAAKAIMALREEEHDLALELFDKAQVLDPSVSKRYQSAIKSTLFWSVFVEAKNSDSPKRGLQLLNNISPGTKEEKVEWYLTQADYYRDLLDIENSEKRVKTVLEIEPNNIRGVATLIDLNIETRDQQDLKRIVSRYSDNPKINSPSQPEMAIKFLRARALLAEAEKKYSVAMDFYEDAMKLDLNNDVWLRMDYAKLFLKLDQRERAEGIIANISYDERDNVGAYAKALFYAETKDWKLVLAEIKKIPSHQLSYRILDLQHRAQFHDGLQEAINYGEIRGKKAVEEKLLALYESTPSSIDERVVMIVNALAKYDLNAPAVAIMKQSVRQDKSLNIGTQFNYIEHLLTFRELTLVETLIDRLERRELNAKEEIRLTEIKLRTLHAYGLKHSEIGDYESSHQILVEALRISPKNSETLRLLGQVSQKQGNNDLSIEYYKEALAIDPKDLWAIKGAVGSALKKGDIDISRNLLESALNHMPNEPAVYELLAQVAQSAGDVKMAIDALNYSEKLRNTQ